MDSQIPVSDAAIAPDLNDLHHSEEVTRDVACQRLSIVNVVYVGRPGPNQWVLIDAGISGSAAAILKAANERFGDDARPAAILLTHAHFDHVGALLTLADKWDVAIYAHKLEHPYLNGSRAYPPPDTHAGGGMMSRLASLFPRDPINVSNRLHELPASGELPALPGWRWIHTPGHTPGHVSFWRETDRCLISGDAFITTRQESAYAVAVQKPELHGPPRYFTPDWETARRSVENLAALDPEIAVTGHGRPLRGVEMRTALHALARDFDRVARPQAR